MPSDAPQRCDSVEHAVTPDRVQVLNHDAYALNETLKANESDGTGKGNVQAALEAGKAFYQELAEIPVGERKLLLKLAIAYNQMEQIGDPAMPTIPPDLNKLDSTGYLPNFEIHYPDPITPEEAGKAPPPPGQKATQFGAEYFRYAYLGMCDIEQPPGPYSSYNSPDPNGEILLPSLHR